MPAKSSLTILERFEAKFERKGADDCWLWTAATTHDGYGNFGSGINVTGAHRWSYMLYVGPIPAGLHVDHLCMVRNCVNPAHLEAVTRQENVRRAVEARRRKREGRAA